METLNKVASLQPITKTYAFKNKLSELPVNLFGSVMGIAGLALALKLAGMSTISEFTGLIAWIIFLLLLISYGLKTYLFPVKVKEEFSHPVSGNFFGTIPIGILLLSSVTRFRFEIMANFIWITGTLLMLVLAYITVHRLLTLKQEHINVTPALLIPGVGTLDVAVTGGNVPFAFAKELNIMVFAIGIILALVFFTIIISRLMHHDKLAQRMEPSLLILIAPFAVGFLAYIAITKHVDLFASILYYFGLFMFTIVFAKVFFKKTPFAYTWWAVGFPIAALSNAAIKYSQYSNTAFSQIIASSILIILSLLIAYMLIKSIYLLINNKLF